MTQPPPFDEQADNLAQIMAGACAGWVEAVFVPRFMEDPTKVERTGSSSFTVTSRSGTVLSFDVTVVDPGA